MPKIADKLENKTRVEFYTTATQATDAKRVARERGEALSEFIRMAMDRCIREHDEEK